MFNPNACSIERRYWYAQLYRALVFAQVTFSDSSDEFEIITSRLRSILDGNFEIEWDGMILGYWVDQTGKEEKYNTVYKFIKQGLVTVEQAAKSIGLTKKQLLAGFKQYNLAL